MDLLEIGVKAVETTIARVVATLTTGWVLLTSRIATLGMEVARMDGSTIVPHWKIPHIVAQWDVQLIRGQAEESIHLVAEQYGRQCNTVEKGRK